MGQIALLSLTASLNPTLVAATTVMLLLAHPTRLMVGYLAGALLTSITIGLVIVFALPQSGTTKTTENTLSPVADLALGGLALLIALVLHSGHYDRLVERRRDRKAKKSDQEPPRWQRELSKGTAHTTFVIGAVLTLPGASYLAGLDEIHKQHFSSLAVVLVVIGFNLVMLWLLEIPLACFLVAPDWTPRAIEQAKAGLSRHGRTFATRGLVIIGTLLVIKGIIGLL